MDNQYPGVNVPDKIIVHHTAYAPDVFQYPLVEQWHKDRGFPLSKDSSHVGYQYLIEKDGSMTQCRSEYEGGAHTIGQNFTSIGVCLAGNFDTQEPTVAQNMTLVRLCYGIMQRHPAITPDKIYPHNHYSETHCYGTNLPADYVQKQLLALIPAFTEEVGMCNAEAIG